MITAFVNNMGTIQRVPITAGEDVPFAATWIDLLSPTLEETKAIEKVLNLEFPTKEEMQEIEASSRLYNEDGAFYLTASIITRADSDLPESQPITFILLGHRLITLRHSDPLPFRQFTALAERVPNSCPNGETALLGLLDAIIDRIADILERVQSDMDNLSNLAFAREKTRESLDFRAHLSSIGRSQVLTSKARDSLISITRLLTFLGRPVDGKADKALERRVKTMNRDVASLSDHATFLQNNISFLLDATLGMLNIEQNGIIKIFSVAAVVFLPPTLIASIYGMNFEYMPPEIHSTYGYPIALGVMIVSAILPFLYFKRKGWL